MANPNTNAQGWVARLYTSIRAALDKAPSDQTGPRMWTDNAQVVMGMMGFGSHLLADEGSYFKIGNATPGTGLATLAAPVAFAGTSPFLIVQNNEPAGGRSIYLDFLRLVCTAPGTLGASLHITTRLDPIATRYTSGATMIVNAAGATGGQIVNPKSSGAAPATVAAWAGPLVATAESSGVRPLAPDLIPRAVIPVAADSYLLKFGGADAPVSAAAKNGVVPSDFLIPHEPVIIDPGHAFLAHLWLPTQSAASSYQIEIAGWLRG